MCSDESTKLNAIPLLHSSFDSKVIPFFKIRNLLSCFFENSSINYVNAGIKGVVFD